MSYGATNASPEEIKDAAYRYLQHCVTTNSKEFGLNLTLLAAGKAPTAKEAQEVFKELLRREQQIQYEAGMRLLAQHFGQAKETFTSLLQDFQANSIIVEPK